MAVVRASAALSRRNPVRLHLPQRGHSVHRSYVEPISKRRSAQAGKSGQNVFSSKGGVVSAEAITMRRLRLFKVTSPLVIGVRCTATGRKG